MDPSPFALSTKVARTPPQQIALSPTPLAPTKPKALQQHNTRSTSYQQKTNKPPSNELQPPSTYSDFTEALNNIRNIASELKVQGANINIRARLFEAIDSTIAKVNDTAPQQEYLTNENRITNIENDIREIKKALLDGTTSDKPKTWAQAISSTIPSPVVTNVQIDIAKREKMEKIKLAKAKTELIISLRSATDETQKTLEQMTEQALTEQIQSSIREHIPNSTGTPILNVSKVNRYILKIQCNTEADKERLASFNWEQYFNGAKQIKPTYGIVVHGVSKKDLDITNLLKVKEQLEEKNNITIFKVMPLMKQPRNPFAPTHSIVIFTETPIQANKCITDGILIDYQRYPANRFVPQYQITQCFKCYRYGHRAEACNTHLTSCGKCSENHLTKECLSNTETLCCILCKGPHPAWSHECPRREKKIDRLKLLRATTPDTFSC